MNNLYFKWVTICIVGELIGIFAHHPVLAEVSVISMATACCLAWIQAKLIKGGEENGYKRTRAKG